MYINRYSSDNLVNDRVLATNRSIVRIRQALNAGILSTTVFTSQETDRLDVMAGRYYGDGRLWWVIAAASGIGWWLQVPSGTRIVVPTDINQVMGLV
jgi:hypothetical protein